MKKYRHKDTQEFYNGVSIVTGKYKIFNPTEEMLFKAGYEVYEEPEVTYEPTEEDNIRMRMQEIQDELTATDYISLKAFEGEDMSNYPDWKEKRAALRKEFRELELELEKKNN